MDASNGMTQVFNLILDGFKFCFNLLDSFQFWGISMLDLTITLFVIATAIPIILAVVRSRSVVSNAERLGRNARSRFNRGDE